MLLSLWKLPDVKWKAAYSVECLKKSLIKAKSENQLMALLKQNETNKQIRWAEKLWPSGLIFIVCPNVELHPIFLETEKEFCSLWVRKR